LPSVSVRVQENRCCWLRRRSARHHSPSSRSRNTARLFEVSWHRIVVEVALHDRFEPFASLEHGIVHAPVELLLDLSQSARMRLRMVVRRTVNRPIPFFPLICWKPRKSNVSGLSSPLRLRFSSANRPNSIRRVFSGCNSSPNFPSRSRKFSKKRSASAWCWNPRMVPSA